VPTVTLARLRFVASTVHPDQLCTSVPSAGVTVNVTLVPGNALHIGVALHAPPGSLVAPTIVPLPLPATAPVIATRYEAVHAMSAPVIVTAVVLDVPPPQFADHDANV
jgi:hypothetical protein